MIDPAVALDRQPPGDRAGNSRGAVYDTPLPVSDADLTVMQNPVYQGFTL
jgi:hypothetical protein